MFLINKKCVFREKIFSGSENLIALILTNNISYSKDKNKKNQKDWNVSNWNHAWKTETTKVHELKAILH